MVCLDFELGLEPGSFVAVVSYKDGKWQMIEDVEIMEDGSVTCTTYEHFCPVAILVAGEQMSVPGVSVPTGNGHVPASTDAPDTGVGANSIVLWTVIAAAAAVALVVLFVAQRKGKEKH